MTEEQRRELADYDRLRKMELRTECLKLAHSEGVSQWELVHRAEHLWKFVVDDGAG